MCIRDSGKTQNCVCSTSAHSIVLTPVSYTHLLLTYVLLFACRSPGRSRLYSRAATIAIVPVLYNLVQQLDVSTMFSYDLLDRILNRNCSYRNSLRIILHTARSIIPKCNNVPIQWCDWPCTLCTLEPKLCSRLLIRRPRARNAHCRLRLYSE